MPVKIELKYGSGKVHAVLPRGRFLGEIRPNSIPPLGQFEQQVINALRNPIGAEPLRKLAAGVGRVAIVTADHTRPLPSDVLLPLVCRELAEAGIREDSITVVFGLGNHRPLTEDEKRRLMGSLYGRVTAVNSKETGYRMLGITKRGTPVEVSAPVADADLVIALGNVEPHQLAGYTGGVKAVAVGAASPRAIEHNHRLSRLAENSLQSPAGNIVRRDMEEFARVTKLKFIVNVVLNESHRAVYVAAGDPVAAHRSACVAADRLFRVKVRERADIVIASPGGFPRDASVYQAQKSLKNALPVAADGGIIIVAAKCPEGFGDPVFEEWIREAGSPDELVSRSAGEFVLGGHKSAFVAEAVQKTRVFWVSDMDPDDVKALFFEPCASLQEAVDKALAIKGDTAGILVMPYAGLTFPDGMNDDTAERGEKWLEDTVVTGV